MTTPDGDSDQPKKRPKLEGTPWPKGKSGNPGGRPKAVAAVRELARQWTEVAIRTLADVCQHGEKEAARVAAAEALLNRAWGRPEQAVQLEGPNGEQIIPVIQITVKKSDKPTDTI
jgi:hypothetical protein